MSRDSPLIPGWRVFFDPGFIARRRLQQLVRELAGRLALDGCGERSYESMFAVESYIGLDVPISGHPPDTKRYDLLFYGNRLPIGSESINGVLCTQVLEHTAHHELLLSKIWRVWKPGGNLVMTVPFAWKEHEKPYDFFHFSEHGLRYLLGPWGFEIVALQKTISSIEALAKLCSIYVRNNLRLPIRGFGRLMTTFICAPIQIVGLAAQMILPDERDLFLDLAVLARKDADVHAGLKADDR